MGIKFKKLKIKKGWDWKIFVISWLIQNIKNNNKKEMDWMWRGNKLRGLSDFLNGLTWNLRVERERKKMIVNAKSNAH